MIVSDLQDIISSYWHLIVIFFAIAVIYSSAGFGGGSSYLAILALTSLSYTEIRATSLLCNIVVVSGGTFIFHRHGLIDWKRILPLVLISTPMAFVGGWLKINEYTFFIILGISLLIASFSMIISGSRSSLRNEIKKTDSSKRNLLFGSGIGLLSGIVGIGGGIFLAPLLHLTSWDIPKKIAATSSVFILLNSLSGLAGQFMNPETEINLVFTITLLVAVLIGGQIGSRLSINMFSQLWVKRVTALLIALVGFRILNDHLFLNT